MLLRRLPQEHGMPLLKQQEARRGPGFTMLFGRWCSADAISFLLKLVPSSPSISSVTRPLPLT
jgi:hypothetical protein